MMEEKHRKLIQTNLSKLLNIVHKIDDVINEVPSMVLNEHMTRYLKSIPDEKSRRREFFEMIQGRGPGAFEALLTALRMTKNFSASEFLVREKLASYAFSLDQIPDHEKPSVESSTDISEFPIDEPDLINISKVGEIIVKKHPQNKFMDVDEDKITAYRMRSNPRGLALLINIYKSPGHDLRRGSEIDLENLVSVFVSLGYKVKKFTDLNCKDMKEQIKLFSISPELSTVDSLVLFIMSHGKDMGGTVDLFAADGGCVNSDWIINQFVRDERSNIDRQPKMFFFQACRPLDPQHKNVRWMKSADSDDNLTCRQEDSEYNSNSRRLSSARSYEDTIIVFSTLPGYLSIRDPLEGSWFVKTFCDVVAEWAWKYDLEALLNLVNEDVRMKECRYGNQIVDINKKGFSKKLFFNPFLFESRTGDSNDINGSKLNHLSNDTLNDV